MSCNVKKHSLLTHIPKDFLVEARVKSVLELNFRDTFLLICDGEVVGVASARKKGRRYWVDRYYVKDVAKRRKSALKLLKTALKAVGYKSGWFYLEIEKNNPHIEDDFYKNCEYVSENNDVIFLRRKLK